MDDRETLSAWAQKRGQWNVRVTRRYRLWTPQFVALLALLGGVAMAFFAVVLALGAGGEL